MDRFIMCVTLVKGEASDEIQSKKGKEFQYVSTAQTKPSRYYIKKLHC